MTLLFGLIIILGIFSLSASNWRRSIKFIFFILVIEGILRKWILPQASETIYFLKDFILLGAYTNYYLFSKEPKFPIKSNCINILIFLVLGWGIFQAFNPSLGSPLVGIFGLRGYLLYTPLIWIVPSLFRSEEELYDFLRIHLLLLIPVGLLGIAQFFSPPTSPLNVYATDDPASIATFGKGGSDLVRVTGTFSYLSGYSVYLAACFSILLPMFSNAKTKLWKHIFTLEILLVLANIFMTGSRTVVFGSSIILVGYIIIQSFFQPSSIIRLGKQFLLPLLISIIALTTFFSPALDAFFLRTTSNQDEFLGRVFLFLEEPIANLKYKELDGYGTGATHQAKRALTSALDLPKGEEIPTQYEQEAGRIVLEIGPIGFIFWYGLRLTIVVNLFFLFLNTRNQLLKELALTAFLLHFFQIRGHLVFHHTFSVYYWFTSGFIFLFPYLEKTHRYISSISQTTYEYYSNTPKRQD